MVEFAASLPFLLLIAMGGAELTHYATTKMRISQLALHVADNISRVGNGSMLSAKKVREIDINDALTGVGLQAGNLDLFTHGRVIVSSLQGETAPTNPGGKYKIAWQRCRGGIDYTSHYGEQGDADLDGIGPSLITAPENGAVVFVEVAFDYQPLFSEKLAPEARIVEVAAMTARDTWDLLPPHNNEGVPEASCAP
ncbi:MAG: hypothetical protein B7Z20_07730 [Sphingobium sp. 32-64-5]|nr:MAG: hypothetical protein B7Z20_07730 [Sphingobium sp. 32-64-5]